MRVFVCEDSFEGIMTAVYDAWASRLGHNNVSLQIQGEYNLDLFSEYVTVETEEEKVEKVVRTLQKISEEVFACTYKAAMSAEQEKADNIYRFIVLAIKHRARVLERLNHPDVMKVFSMARRVGTEAHRFLQFVRFRELENGILFSKIEPKSHIITMVAPHFDDRLPEENWIIYDATHNLAAVHAKRTPWVLTRETELFPLLSSKKEADYEELWKIFFRTISIESRKNPNCQRNMLPLWYRKNMLEFDTVSGL